MTLKEIENLTDEQLNRLTLPEIKQAVRKAATGQYNRFKRLEQTDNAKYSPLYQSLEEQLGGKVTDSFYRMYGEGGIKDLNEGRKRLSRLVTMLNKESSTISGTNRQLRRLFEAPERVNLRTGKKEGREKIDMTFEEWKKGTIEVHGERRTYAQAYWDLYAEIEKSGVFALYDSGSAQDFISVAVNTGEDISDWQHIIDLMEKYGSTEAYKRSLEEKEEIENREREFTALS